MRLKNLLLLAAIGLVMAACQKNPESPNANGKTTISSIESGGERFSTRFNSFTETWEIGDAIGVYMLDATNTAPVSDGANVEFTTRQAAATVTFSADPGIEIADEPVNFFAYYPHNPDISADFKYTIDLSDQTEGYAAYDLMWAKKANVTADDLNTDGLSLTFEHKLTMLVVNISSFPDGITSLTDIFAAGVNTAAEYDLVSGDLTLGNVIKTLKLHKVDNDTYAAIILPTETPESILFTFMAEDRKFQYNVPSTIDAFNPGSKYVFNIALGTSGTQGSFTEITGGSTPWGDEGGSTGTGSEVPNNPDVPADYTSVSVTAENFSTIINSVAGKVALLFDATIEYPAVAAMTVPATVTELLFIGEGDTPSVLSLAEISTHLDLKRVFFKNLNITGDIGRTFLFNKPDYEFAPDATVEIINCDFNTMKAVCGWDEKAGSKNVLASFVIDNSVMSNMGTMFNQYRSKYISTTNSTFHTMTGRLIYPSTYDGVPQPTVIVENCTLVDLMVTPIEANSANGNMTYKNNISAITNSHRNLAYKMNIIEFSGNYAAAETDAAIQVHNNPVPATFENAWVSLTMTRAELFPGWESGDFTTTVDAGDPRWRQVQP